MLKIDKTGVRTSKRVYFWMFLPSMASVMAARPCFCSFLLFVVEVPANFVETAKEQSHAQCHVTHRIRIFDKISEHVKVPKLVDIAVPELAVTLYSLLDVKDPYLDIFHPYETIPAICFCQQGVF